MHNNAKQKQDIYSSVYNLQQQTRWVFGFLLKPMLCCTFRMFGKERKTRRPQEGVRGTPACH